MQVEAEDDDVLANSSDEQDVVTIKAIDASFKHKFAVVMVPMISPLSSRNGLKLIEDELGVVHGSELRSGGLPLTHTPSP